MSKKDDTPSTWHSISQFFFDLRTKWNYDNIHKHVDELAERIEREHYGRRQEEEKEEDEPN